MQRKSKKQSPSIKPQTDPSISSNTKLPSPETTPSPVLYHTLSQVPLDILIDCLCDGQTEKLIISGSPTAKELQQAWDEIYDDFVFKMQDEDARYVSGLVRELNILRTNINIVETIVKFLEFLFTAPFTVTIDDLVEKLNKYTGEQFLFDQSDKKQCYRLLEVALASTKQWYVEAENIKLQINHSISNTENHGALDRDYFDHLLVALSIHQKFKVNRRETTGGEFVVMIQTLRKQKNSQEEFSNN